MKTFCRWETVSALLIVTALSGGCAKVTPRAAVAPTANKDALRDKPIAGLKIDTHYHFLTPGHKGEPDWDAFSDGYPDTYAGAEQALRSMEGAGIDKVVALSAAYFFSDAAPAARENTFTAAEVAKHPEKLIGFCGVNVAKDWAVAELTRCKTELGLKALKIHLTANKLTLHNEEHVARVNTVFQKANELKMPILVDFNKHDTGEVFKLFRLTFRYPEARFIIAHALSLNYRETSFFPRALKESPSLPRNVYMDISATAGFFADSPEREQLVWYLRKFGIDRIFLGSDYPVYSTEESFRAIEAYPLTEAEKRGIRGENFAKFWAESTATPAVAK